MPEVADVFRGMPGVRSGLISVALEERGIVLSIAGSLLFDKGEYTIRPDAAPYLADIAAPTLVVVGNEDTPTPVADARSLVEGITGARLEIIDGAGHLSNLERPEAFTSALTRFLAA